MKSSKVSIKTRSTPASLSFKGQATKHTTVKWPIEQTILNYRFKSIDKYIEIHIHVVRIPKVNLPRFNSYYPQLPMKHTIIIILYPLNEDTCDDEMKLHKDKWQTIKNHLGTVL